MLSEEDEGYAPLPESDEEHAAVTAHPSPEADEGKPNPNVRLILVIVVVAGLSESIGYGTVLAAYLYLINGDSNTRY